MPGLNSIYNEYGKNQNTLLLFETNFPDSKSSFASWCEDKGVQYGAISKDEGGQAFNIALDNNNYGNPKYLIHPDRTFEKITSSVQATLDAANVSKDGLVDDDTEDPTVSLTSSLGGKTYTAGENISLEWTASDNEGVASIKLEYYDGSWNEIATLTGDKTSYTWTTPSEEILGCKVRVTASDAANNSAADESGTFDVTIVVDTTDPSMNLLVFTSMYPLVDDFGSKVDTTDGFTTDDGVQVDFEIASSDSANDKWTWGSILSELPPLSTMVGVNYIKVTYTANEDISLVLQQEGLIESGESYRATLKKSTTPKTVLLKVDADTFKKPEWSSATTALDLEKVSAISFETKAKYSGGDYSIGINEIILYGYQGSENVVNTAFNISTHSISISSMQNGLKLFMPATQEASIKIVGTNGRVVHSVNSEIFSAGFHTLPLPTAMAKGVYLVVCNSGLTEHVQKITIGK